MAQATESGALSGGDSDVFTATAVSSTSLDIENVPPEDRGAFTRGLEGVAEGAVAGLIAGSKNLYVAHVTGVKLGRRSLKFMDYGIMAATFLNLETGRAFRAPWLTPVR